MGNENKTEGKTPSGIKKSDIQTVRPNITSVFNPAAYNEPIPQPKRINTQPVTLNADGKAKSLSIRKPTRTTSRNLPQESMSFAKKVKEGSMLLRVVK